MTAFNQIFVAETVGDTLIVIPQGDATGFRYADLHNESNIVHHRLDDPAIQNLIVDLSQMETIGSTVISVIVKLLRKVSNKGGQARMCAASENTCEVLDTMNICKLWPYFATREQALQAIQSQDAATATDDKQPDATA